MRVALFHALERLLRKDFNEEVAAARGEPFDMLAAAMQKHAGGNPEAEAFARIFGGKSPSNPGSEGSAKQFLSIEGEADSRT